MTKDNQRDAVAIELERSSACLEEARILLGASRPEGATSRQAVRLPKEMRLPGQDVVVRRRGRTLVIEPVDVADDRSAFWESLLPLEPPIRRHKTRSAEKRRAV